METDTPDAKRSIWMRAIFMLLMALILHVCGTLLFVIAIIQFVVQLLNGTPNDRLSSFGRHLGSYFRQVVCFLTYATEDIPFPFSEWPANE